MKKLFLLALPMALAAVSCSNEEVVSVNNDANEITFTAVANNATRAADSYCNYDMPDDFNVWACVDNKQYFANVEYTKGSGTVYTAAGGEVHFWPTTATPVSFWAAKNHNVDGGSFSWPADGTQPKIVDFTPALTAAAQHDLLYAYTVQSRPAYGADETGQNGGKGIVPMNFRHALSQVVFKAKVSNPTIKVEIDQVEVCRINGKGTFTYPSSVTNDNWDKHDNSAVTENGVGSWTMHATDALDTDYTTGAFTAVSIAYNADETAPATNLTDETTAHNATPRKFSNTLMLLPQTTAKWAHTAGTTGTGVDASGATGAYFLVHCRIWNVSDASLTNEVILWSDKTDTSKTAAVAIPVDIAWEPGRKYIYTFNFGTTTTGGFDPSTGEDVLIPISFNVTVDDFVNVTDKEISMK